MRGWRVAVRGGDGSGGVFGGWSWLVPCSGGKAHGLLLAMMPGLGRGTRVDVAQARGSVSCVSALPGGLGVVAVDATSLRAPAWASGASLLRLTFVRDCAF